MPPATLERSTQRFRQARVTQDAGSGVLTVEGWLVTYGQRNENGYLWVPGAGAECLQKRAEMGRSLPMGLQHHWGEALQVIGRWQTWEISKDGVYGVGAISDTQAGRDAATLVSDKALDGISVGFHDVDGKTRVLGPGDMLEVDTMFGPFRYQAEDWTIAFIDAEIDEASIVHCPADEDALLAASYTQALERAGRALPGLQSTESWDDVAYSMALLMGGRGATQAFTDLPVLQRAALYEKLAGAYQAFGKTPPAYQSAPDYKTVAFEHDEREIFADRYLRKGLATVQASARGFEGQLSPETREHVQSSVQELEELLARHTQARPIADELRELAARVRAVATTPEGEQK